MATLAARSSARNPEFVNLCAQMAGNAVTTNIAERPGSHKGGCIRVINASGATPTCTYLIETSVDGTVWINATYADISTPTVDVTTTFVLTTSTVATKIIKQPAQWRFIRVTTSANTNITNTIDFLYDDSQTPPWS
jgi:hypothetical protein